MRCIVIYNFIGDPLKVVTIDATAEDVAQLELISGLTFNSDDLTDAQKHAFFYVLYSLGIAENLCDFPKHLGGRWSHLTSDKEATGGYPIDGSERIYFIGFC